MDPVATPTNAPEAEKVTEAPAQGANLPPKRMGPQPVEAKVGRVETEIPGCPEGTKIALEMTESHAIMVDRPSAWGSGFREAPEKYQWLGGIPEPGSKGAPGKGGYTADDQAWSDPIIAVIKANRPNRTVSKDDKAAGKATWDSLWSDFSGHIDERTARICATYGYDAGMYAVLCKRPDLVDILTTCPALGPFIDEATAAQIPAMGWSLAQVAGFLLAPSVPGTTERQPVKVPPGFMAWAKNMKWEPSRLPPFPKEDEARASAMRAFVRMAHEAGARMDPNGIQQIGNENAWKKVNFPIDEDKAWLLLNSILASRGTAKIATHVLKSPAAAVKSVAKYFPDGMKKNYRDKIGIVLETVLEWVNTSNVATKIAGTPGVLERFPAFARLTEEAREWDREMRAEELRQHQAREAEIARRAADQELQARLAHERALAGINRARARGAQYLLPATIDPAKAFPIMPKLARVANEQWQMIHLFSGALLQEESVVMNHCVAAYHAPKCVEGGEIVFSVRPAERAQGQPLATVAVNPKTGAIMEMRGKGNGELDAGLQTWIRASVARVMQEGLEVDQAAMPQPKRRGQPVAI